MRGLGKCEGLGIRACRTDCVMCMIALPARRTCIIQVSSIHMFTCALVIISCVRYVVVLCAIVDDMCVQYNAQQKGSERVQGSEEPW